VDEIGADANPLGRGDVWSFTVSDRVVVDDFESYDLVDDYLYESWPVRSWAWTSLEWDVVRSCLQSIETFRCFERPQDWTRHGAQGLQIMLHGKPGNATDGQLYLTLSDGAAEQYVLYQGDMDALARDEWTAWRMAFDDFNSIDLTHVESMAIGLRPLSPQPSHRSAGTIYIDDICLYRHLCMTELQPSADVTADCAVDYRDVEQMAADWLQARPLQLLVETPNEPVLWYRFDGNTRDDAGGADGEMRRYPGGDHDRVLAVRRRFAARQRHRLLLQLHLRAIESRRGRQPRPLARPGPVSLGLRLSLVDGQPPRWTPQDQERMGGPVEPLGLHEGRAPGPAGPNRPDGNLPQRRPVRPPHGGTDSPIENVTSFEIGSPIENVTSFEIGSGWYGHYDGLIDDFRIYDYALSAPEAAWLATDGTGVFDDPIAFRADLNADQRVDLADFTILADQWLETGLRP